VNKEDETLVSKDGYRTDDAEGNVEGSQRMGDTDCNESTISTHDYIIIAR